MEQTITSSLLQELYNLRPFAMYLARINGMNDPGLVDDVMQDAAVAILKIAHKTYNPAEGSLREYARAIVRYLICKLAKRARRDRQATDEFDLFSEDMNPLDIAARREAITHADQALQRMSEGDRAAICRWADPSANDRHAAQRETASARNTRNHRIRYRFLAELIRVRSRPG